jgi:signal transduction histidine kinase
MKAGRSDTLRGAPAGLQARASDLIQANETSSSAGPYEKADAAERIFHCATAEATAQPVSRFIPKPLNESLERQAKRIAQALHDEAGQLLAAAHMALAEAARDLPAQARERLRAVDSHLDGLEEQLRRLAHELRPRILDDLGLVPALEFLAEGFGKRRAISVAVYAALDRQPAVIETTIYRVIQEALTNVGKHSRATHVGIGLSQVPGMLLCTIDDDGGGFDASAIPPEFGEPGFGLAGAHDQITALGGTMQINSAPGAGTKLVIRIPLEE